MIGLRWWLWEQAEWLAYHLCPDKKALGVVRKHGWVQAKQAMEYLREQRSTRPGGRT